MPSAYNEKGLLKKNPLLGTSLAVDESRNVEREKFGALHERALEAGGTKEEFQAAEKVRYDEAQAPGLAAFAQGQEDLAAQRSNVAEFRSRMRSNQNIQSKNAELQRIISSGNMKKATAFEKANPEVAKAARDLWQSNLDSGLRKGDMKSYYKGKRSKINKEAYEALGLDMEEQEKRLNESMPELMKQLQEQHVASTGGGLTSSENTQKQFGKFGKELASGIGGFYGYAGTQLFDADAWGKHGAMNLARAFDPSQGAFKHFKSGDIMGGVMQFGQSVLDPGNLVNIGKSLFGIGSKKKLRAAKRNQRAGGRMGLLSDTMGLESGRAGLQNMQDMLGLTEARVKEGTLANTVAQQRKTLEDQANFYGSFFS